GERCEFHRHDNGLHLGQAKHEYRNWITIMDHDFQRSGMYLMRSRKHAGSGFHPGFHPNMNGPKGSHEGKPGKGGNDGKGGPEGKPGNDGKGGNNGKGGNAEKGGNDGGGNDGKGGNVEKGGHGGKGK
ncbi:MAG: hypothetical protein ACYC1Q_06685, partial [Bacteroidia bacterium]